MSAEEVDNTPLWEIDVLTRGLSKYLRRK